HQNTAINAAMGLHDDGKTGGALNSWRQYAKSGDIIFDVAGGLGGGVGAGLSGVGAKTSKVVGKIVKSVNKVKVLKTANTRKQFADLFDKIKPNNQITIGNKKLTVLPESGNAKIFERISDKQVMTYFKQLTGSKLPKPIAKKFKVGDNKFEYGVIYKIKTDKGYFTLRNKSASNLSDGSKPRWTIDVSKKIAGTGRKGTEEIKFK
ncbi:hypothetical protein BSPCLSOX_1396, partial [uncultured Gammaproteobacteria bacterium]